MPRSSRAQMALHRQDVLEGAAHLLRSSGPAAVTVAAATAGAGLTAGAFYKQFVSKDALLSEASNWAVDRSREDFDRLLKNTPEQNSTRDTLITAYLSDAHVDDLGSGCVISTLASDVTRDPDSPMGDAVSIAITELVRLLTSADGDREQALTDAATIVGAVIIARAARGSDASDEILRAARHALVPDQAVGDGENKAMRTQGASERG